MVPLTRLPLGTTNTPVMHETLLRTERLHQTVSRHHPVLSPGGAPAQNLGPPASSLQPDEITQALGPFGLGSSHNQSPRGGSVRSQVPTGRAPRSSIRTTVVSTATASSGPKRCALRTLGKILQGRKRTAGPTQHRRCHLPHYPRHMIHVIV